MSVNRSRALKHRKVYEPAPAEVSLESLSRKEKDTAASHAVRLCATRLFELMKARTEGAFLPVAGNVRAGFNGPSAVDWAIDLVRCCQKNLSVSQLREWWAYVLAGEYKYKDTKRWEFLGRILLSEKWQLSPPSKYLTAILRSGPHDLSKLPSLRSIQNKYAALAAKNKPPVEISEPTVSTPEWLELVRAADKVIAEAADRVEAAPQEIEIVEEIVEEIAVEPDRIPSTLPVQPDELREAGKGWKVADMFLLAYLEQQRRASTPLSCDWQAKAS